MNLWAHLINALTGADGDESQPWSDSQALRLLDKEIRQADTRLRESRDALASLLAEQKLTEARIKTSSQRIDELEDYARQALDKNEDALAREIVETIMPLDIERNSDRELIADYKAAVQDIQLQVRAAEMDMKQLKQQVATIKATASVQKAQATVNTSSSTRQSAQTALEKMRQRQAEKSARLQAERSLDDTVRRNDLIERLKQAGIDTGHGQAKAILDRIKHKE